MTPEQAKFKAQQIEILETEIAGLVDRIKANCFSGCEAEFKTNQELAGKLTAKRALLAIFQEVTA